MYATCSGLASEDSMSGPWRGWGEQQPGLQRPGLPRSPCLPPRAHAHAPLPADMREVKGDDNHRACVITSTIGLAYQTLTGPGTSVSEPPPPTHWYLVSVQPF